MIGVLMEPMEDNITVLSSRAPTQGENTFGNLIYFIFIYKINGLHVLKSICLVYILYMYYVYIYIYIIDNIIIIKSYLYCYL